MISETQQFIIQKLIATFEITEQRPCHHTVHIMTEVIGFMEGGNVQAEVRYMMDGKSNSVRFVYDHPRAYAEFYQAFWQQWNSRQEAHRE